jgi:hypothetical protein
MVVNRIPMSESIKLGGGRKHTRLVKKDISRQGIRSTM